MTATGGRHHAPLPQWLDETRLAPVPHRQVVLTIPKRLRAYGLSVEAC